MNSTEIKNNMEFSDLLDKYNQSYYEAFLELYQKYIKDTNSQKKNFERIKLFINTYISKFSLVDFCKFASRGFSQIIVDEFLNETINPIQNLSETKQTYICSIFCIGKMQYMQKEDIQADLKSIVLDMHELKHEMREIEKEQERIYDDIHHK